MIKNLTDKHRPPKTKVCKRCKKEKPLKEFQRHGETKDGRHPKCKDCTKEVEAKKKEEDKKYSKRFFTF
jgi:hypothetical protein